MMMVSDITVREGEREGEKREIRRENKKRVIQNKCITRKEMQTAGSKERRAGEKEKLVCTHKLSFLQVSATQKKYIEKPTFESSQ